MFNKRTSMTAIGLLLALFQADHSDASAKKVLSKRSGISEPEAEKIISSGKTEEFLKDKKTLKEKNINVPNEELLKEIVEGKSVDQIIAEEEHKKLVEALKVEKLSYSKALSETKTALTSANNASKDLEKAKKDTIDQLKLALDDITKASIPIGEFKVLVQNSTAALKDANTKKGETITQIKISSTSLNSLMKNTKKLETASKEMSVAEGKASQKLKAFMLAAKKYATSASKVLPKEEENALKYIEVAEKEDISAQKMITAADEMSKVTGDLQKEITQILSLLGKYPNSFKGITYTTGNATANKTLLDKIEADEKNMGLITEMLTDKLNEITK